MSRALAIALLLSASVFADKQPFDIHALLKLARISDPLISPDARMITFTVQTIDIDNNKRLNQIYTVPLQGGTPRRITEAGENNQRARWSPDSKTIAFLSDRSGSTQVWLMNADGANARQFTNLSTEAGGVQFSPDGKYLVFTSDVYPECGADDACNKKKLDAEKQDKVKARTYSDLLYRHWTQWQSKRRSHLLMAPIAGGPPKDLTPGPLDVPPFSLGGSDDYAIAPDSGEICYATNDAPTPAVSTNSDLYAVAVASGISRKITVNPGADSGPLYSPDGKYLAYRSQLRGGYESDRWRLSVLERATGKVTILTDNLDRWVNSFTWSPDSSTIFFTSEDRGRQSIQYIAVSGGALRIAASGDNHLDDMQLTPDGKTMIYTQQSGSQPVEIYRASASGGTAQPLTHLNDAILGTHQLNAYEEFWVDGAEQTKVQSFLVKPHGFRPDQKYPVLMLIHGGPQGAWAQSWSYRWNAQVFASAGYLVVMPNPRGSTGYGQKFIDEINQDWGGRAFDDIMAATDHAARLPYTDSSRIAVAGASYGGYMVNWMLGHTQRFKAMVSHAGVFDLRSMFGETEELWFPLWEFAGTPWDNADLYARWSPSFAAKEFRTPTLVTAGELDYRVPYGQSLQLFTALQLQKVPSKLLLFPDEGHWILKPQNSLLWYTVFIDWVNSWTKK